MTSGPGAGGFFRGDDRGTVARECAHWRVRNPARGQSPRQDRSIPRNRIDWIFDGSQSPEVASNPILDRCVNQQHQMLREKTNWSPGENGRDQERLLKRQAGPANAETRTSPGEGIKPAKGAEHLNPMSAAG